MRQNKKFQSIVIIAGVLPVIALLLTGCGGVDFGNTGRVYIEPGSVTLAPGQTQVFTGHTTEFEISGCKWGVREGDRGGAITDISDPQETLSRPTAVTYTAPMTPGTYHLRLVLNPQFGDHSAEATIQVR